MTRSRQAPTPTEHRPMFLSISRLARDGEKAVDQLFFLTGLCYVKNRMRIASSIRARLSLSELNDRKARRRQTLKKHAKRLQEKFFNCSSKKEVETLSAMT